MYGARRLNVPRPCPLQSTPSNERTKVALLYIIFPLYSLTFESYSQKLSRQKKILFHIGTNNCPPPPFCISCTFIYKFNVHFGGSLRDGIVRIPTNSFGTRMFFRILAPFLLPQFVTLFEDFGFQEKGSKLSRIISPDPNSCKAL